MKPKYYQTQKNQIRGLTKQEYSALRALCRLSKNLYNVALYSIRQYYFTEKKFLRYESNYHACKDNENYRLLNTDIAQQTIKVVNRNFLSFFALLKKARKSEYRFQDVRLPKYLEKEGYFSLIMPRIKVKDGFFPVPMSIEFKCQYGEVKIPFPKRLEGKNIKEVRIHPRFDARFFEVEFVYEAELEPQDLNKEKCLAIDLGIDNLATCVSTNGASFIVDGRKLKSINHRYNKRMVYLSSIRQHQNMDHYTALQCRLTICRNNQIRDYMNKTARYIINYCIDHKIGTLVSGYNPDWKRNINIGKVNNLCVPSCSNYQRNPSSVKVRKTAHDNQNFVQIPHGQLRLKLRALCERYAIDYLEQKESYTSKASEGRPERSEGTNAPTRKVS